MRGQGRVKSSTRGGRHPRDFTWEASARRDRKAPAQCWAARGATDAQPFPGHPFSYWGQMTLTLGAFVIVIVSIGCGWSRPGGILGFQTPLAGRSETLVSPLELGTAVDCQDRAQWSSPHDRSRDPRQSPGQPTHLEPPHPRVLASDTGVKLCFPPPRPSSFSLRM